MAVPPRQRAGNLDHLAEEFGHSPSLSTGAEIASPYWQGALVEELGLTVRDDQWPEAPVIEALFRVHWKSSRRASEEARCQGLPEAYQR